MQLDWLRSGWKLKTDGVILPEERLPAAQTALMGVQHVVGMFGGTILVPLLVGFDPNVALLCSGMGTLIYLVAVGGRMPSYLGSSGAFIAVVIAAPAYPGEGANANIGVALGGIIAAGVIYTLAGVCVVLAGHHWVERLMPPVVIGTVVAVIGLNLAPIAVKAVSSGGLEIVIGLATVLLVALVAVHGSGFSQRIPILIGGATAYLLYTMLANGFALGTPVDFGPVIAADWVGIPKFSAPVFETKAMILIAPAAIVLIAENLGHLKALSAMMGRNLDAYIGRAFVGDGIATIVAGSAGGIGVTTYAENIGIMGMTKVFSTLVFVAAALFAILLGFCPKFGALILTIPAPVIGGLSLVLFGLITATAGRIWVENKVAFSEPENLIIVGACLVAGAGNLSLEFGGFALGGVGTASLGAIILYQLLQRKSPNRT
jgi:putative pyrimidine permease RutG